MKARILFVDDEPRVLTGLRRMLSGMHEQWELHSASSGQEALLLAERFAFDVVISDMRMPGMDGVAFLGEFRARQPGAVRIVLSGHSDRTSALGSARVAQQYLTKPCKPAHLKATIERALALRDLVTDEELRRLINSFERLPSLPQLYVELVRELERPTASVRTAGEIIGRDVGMSAKVLQFVNSAFFGIPRRVTSAQQAAVLLGLNLLKALVLGFQVFNPEHRPEHAAALTRLRLHSLKVSGLARRIALEEGLAGRALEDVVAAGMLHDVGRLLLLELPGVIERVAASAAELGGDPLEAEQRVLGTTHDQLGAYLLGLWGLPSELVELVAHHHRPALAEGPRAVALWAVHVADFVVGYVDGPTPLLERSYAARGGLALDGDLERWRNLLGGALE